MIGLLTSNLLRRKLIVQFFFCLQALLLYPASHTLAASADYEYRSVCPSPSGGRLDIDKWNFYKCECTSYAAQMITKNRIYFHNQMKSPTTSSAYYQDRWSHAKYWKAKALSLGYKVSSTPVQGAIAWWGAASWNRNYGHVAHVDSVTNGKANISEYNYKSYQFGTRSGVTADAYIIFGGSQSKPAAPSGLSASVSGTSITLKWKDTSSNESGFNVYRSTGSSWTNLPQKPAGSTSHTDSGLSSSKTYSYKVCAYNATGESCSSSVSAKTGSSSSSSSGSSWDGKNPSGTTCEKDAKTVARRSNSYGQVELRWSNTCKTNWTRIISNSSSYSTYGKIRRTSDQKTYKTSGTGSRFTNMVYAPNVQACASGTIKGYTLSEVCR